MLTAILLTVSSHVPTDALAQSTADILMGERQKAMKRESIEPSSRRAEETSPEEDIMRQQLEVITGKEDASYKVKPGDTLTIVYKDRSERIKTVYKVAPEGTISLALVGDIKVDGLGRDEVEARVNATLKEYIRYPEARVQINTHGRYIVTGAVNGPGVYDLKPNLTVMEALFQSGGFIKSKANMRSVMVMREQGGGVVEVVRLDLNKLLTKGDRSDDLPVRPGDVIHVPTTFIHNLDSFKNTVITNLLDYYTLGGSAPLED